MAKHRKGVAIPRPLTPPELAEHVKPLGLTLALLRNLRGKTQAQVARAAGLETAQLDRFERGQERPDFLDTLPRLLRALPATEEDFITTWRFFVLRARNYAPGPATTVDERLAGVAITGMFDLVLLFIVCGFVSQPDGQAFADLVVDFAQRQASCLEGALFREGEPAPPVPDR